ncbi:hypothetical protein ACQKHI_27850, partial [Escherichia coli]|uniref:hypothetical protein n=1 Tax=Escherichia coli TaxID=562 RepID=UPI003CFD45CA
MNTSRDEILDVSVLQNPILSTNTPEVSRFVIKFPTTEISDVITNKVGNNVWSASLKLYLAKADQIPLDYTVYCHPLSSSWNMGT